MLLEVQLLPVTLVLDFVTVDLWEAQVISQAFPILISELFSSADFVGA